MKTILLTGKRGGKALVSDSDYFDLSKYNWNHGRVGYPTRFYKKEDGGYTRQAMHTFLIGTKKGMVVDHINQNKLDNRRENLRFLSFSDSLINRKMQWNNTQGQIGVYKTNSGWSVELQYKKKKHYFGHFKNKGEAIKKAKESRHKLYGHLL